MSHDTAKSDQDKFRCFLLDLTNANQTISLSQSNDASCEGLASPQDGIRNLKLTRLDANRASSTFFSNQFNNEPCTFPIELVNKRLLSTLDGTSIYEFANNFTLNIRNSRNKQLISSFSCLTQKSIEQHFNTYHQYNTIDKTNLHHPKTSAWSIRSHSTQSTASNLNSNNVQTRSSVGHVINNLNASNNYLEYIIHSTKEW